MDSLSSKWASLGVAFYSDPIVSSPEEVLIDTVKSGEFPEDKKMISIALMWLREYSQLVHIERLRNMMGELDAFEMSIMGGIARKCSKLGDKRWETIERFVLGKTGEVSSFKKSDSEIFLRMRGTDADFLFFGVRVAPIFPEDNKKLMRRDHAIRGNIWLKNRSLFGSNMRADVASLMEMGVVKNGYEASKLAKCSSAAGYRNFSSLTEAGWPLNIKSQS